MIEISIAASTTYNKLMTAIQVYNDSFQIYDSEIRRFMSDGENADIEFGIVSSKAWQEHLARLKNAGVIMTSDGPKFLWEKQAWEDGYKDAINGEKHKDVGNISNYSLPYRDGYKEGLKEAKAKGIFDQVAQDLKKLKE